MSVSLKTISLAVALVMAGTAAAHAKAYIQLNLFGTYMSDQDLSFATGGSTESEYDIGGGYGAAIGYGLRNGLRLEAEYLYFTNEVDDNAATIFNGDYDAEIWMASGIFDLGRAGDSLRPYIGAGLGYAQVGDGNREDDVLAYQGVAGVTYPISGSADAVIGYRYIGTQDAEYRVGNNTAEASYDTHNLQLGLRLNF